MSSCVLFWTFVKKHDSTTGGHYKKYTESYEEAMTEGIF